MNEENRDVKIDAGVAPSPAPTGEADRTKRLRLWVNWALAALTVVCAGFVMVYFFGAVMSTAACS